MKIPNKIKGYGFIYPVKQVKDFKWAGEIDHKTGIITLNKSRHIRSREQALIHELVHFVSVEEGMKLKESQVEKLGKGLYQVLKDSNLLK